DTVESRPDYQKAVVGLVQAGRPGFTVYSPGGRGSDERGRIIAYAPLRNLPFGVVVDRHTDSGLNLLGTLRTQMILVGSIAFLLALGGAWITSRAVVRPLRILTDASRRIAAGDLDSPVDVAGGDEVGNLARHFDQMRAQLKASFQEIQGWSAEMEERVRQRTEELQRRNRELEAASSVAAKIGESLNLQEVLEHGLDEVLEVLGLKYGEICVLDETTQSMTPVAHRGISIEFARELDRFQRGQDLPGIVAETGAPLIIENLADDPRFLRKLIHASEINSAVGFPLVAHGQVVGVMDLFGTDRPPLSPTDFHLLQVVGNQIGVAIRNARLYEDARANEELRRELLERAINAQEDERKRLARELHDEIGQVLTGLVMSLDGAEATIPETFRDIKERLGQLRNLTADTLGEVRRLMLDLRPTLLDDLGLIPAISWYAENYLAKANIKARVEAVNMKERLPQEVETNLFRIVQEAITNIMKHAEARTVEIKLARQDGLVHASIEDDGKGFDTSSLRRPSARGSALGIFGIRERVDLLGGTFNVSSSPGNGTRLELVIPARPREAAIVQD
ncbi:MAG: GAF domain-containing protein, partial [Chloroflexi bacterium]|nr:GAF domain-containing protein [Chloroflexota bacterium]